jgi:hypothetical protein
VARPILRVPRDSDAPFLAANLRAEDKAEVEAATGWSVEAVLRRSIAASSHVTIAEYEGEPVAVFGLVPISLASGTAAPWLLGTDALGALRCSLTRLARLYVSEALRLYPVLVNHVDARNAASVKLLRWLGFSIEEAQPFGARGLPFHRFELRGDGQCAAVSPTRQDSSAHQP